MPSLTEIKSKLPQSLQEKLDYSISLLQKAEHLALSYDPENGYYLAFSGGKDSQALYHVAQLSGVKFKAHMNLTSVDPPEVIRFVKHTYPDVELIKPKDSIFNLAVKKQFLPSMRIRWCCEEFKETVGAGKVTLIGIRHQESARRAKRNEVEINSRKFSGTLEELDEYREKKSKKRGQSINITNARGERTLGCISGKESLLISPIIKWTEKDVWAFLKAAQIPHCELYDQGFHRIGCIGCPMSSIKQKHKENERYPHVKRNWIKAIMKIRRGGGNFTQLLYVVGNRIPEPITDCGGGGTSHTPTLGTGFSESSSPDGLTDEQRELQIAEAIYDWWISGKSYKRWFADTYMQQKLPFK